MPVYAYVCMKHAHAELEHACTYACMRTHALGFPWPYFSKNSLFDSWKSYIFWKHFPQVNLNLMGLKTTLGFRTLTSLRKGGSSHKGYKMRCLQSSSSSLCPWEEKQLSLHNQPPSSHVCLPMAWHLWWMEGELPPWWTRTYMVGRLRGSFTSLGCYDGRCL